MLEQFDILTLSNNKKYTVAQLLEYNNHEYLFLIEVNDKEELLDDKMIVEKIKKDKGYSVRPVKDKETLKIVSDKFIEMLKQEK